MAEAGDAWLRPAAAARRAGRCRDRVDRGQCHRSSDTRLRGLPQEAGQLQSAEGQLLTDAQKTELEDTLVAGFGIKNLKVQSKELRPMSTAFQEALGSRSLGRPLALMAAA